MKKKELSSIYKDDSYYRKIFLKSFFLSFICISLSIFFIYSTFKKIIAPPVVPQYTATVETKVEAAFLSPEGEAEDLNIGGNLHAPEGFTGEDRKEEFYTFLIVGKDGGINTDTIIIASYDGINQTVNVISIPRDTKVNVKRRVKKINAAYPAGTIYETVDEGEDGGIKQLKREVKTLVGFVPDFYCTIDLEAFTKVVDSIGGTEIDVPFHMLYDDPEQNLHIDIPEGLQKLDGENTLKFARYRKGNNGKAIITDYERIEHQQTVMKEMLKALLRPANILKMPEFISIFNEHVDSDINPQNMLWFANQINKTKDTISLNTHTLPTDGTSGSPDYYEYPYGHGIVELVNETINPFNKNISLSDLDLASKN